MKKLATILILALLLGSLGAQEMAWINPYDTSDLANIGAFPGSMLSYVSDGIFYDEWDVVFHAPAELSNYTGINLLTSYGNYASWKGGYTAINPFTTGGFTPAPFMVGVSMPILGYRAAALAGFDFDGVTPLINDRNGDGTTIGIEKRTQTDIVDTVGTIGQTDYTTSFNFNYTDYSQGNHFTFGGGVDLGFLGASIGVVLDSSTRMIGGHYGYTNAIGTDTGYTFANNTITALTINYGSANGAANLEGYDASFDRGKVGIIAELPMFKDFPITGELDVSWSNCLWDAFNVNNIPAYYSTTTTRVAGVNNTTGTYTYTTASGASTGWTNAYPAAVSAPLTGAGLFAAANTYIAASPFDMSGLGYGNIRAGLKAGVDPSIKLASNIKLVARGKLGYSFGLVPTRTAYESAIAYRSPVDATANNDVRFTMNYSQTGSNTEFQHYITSELGGVFEFSGANRALTLGTGFFALPSAYLESTVQGATTTTRSQSLVDPTNNLGAVDMIAATGGAAVGAILASGTPYRGAAALTQTTTYTGSVNYDYIDFPFVLPFSAKINFEKAKLQLVGGYDIGMGVHYQDNSNNVHASNVAYSGITLTNNAGTSVYTAPAGAVATTSSTNATYSGGWGTSGASGTAKWMIRWDPMSAITVDFLGSSVINALNFNLFGATTGNLALNPSRIITNLSMSVTFHF